MTSLGHLLTPRDRATGKVRYALETLLGEFDRLHEFLLLVGSTSGQKSCGVVGGLRINSRIRKFGELLINPGMAF